MEIHPALAVVLPTLIICVFSKTPGWRFASGFFWLLGLLIAPPIWTLYLISTAICLPIVLAFRWLFNKESQIQGRCTKSYKNLNWKKGLSRVLLVSPYPLA